MENEINSEDLFDDDKFKSISEAYEAGKRAGMIEGYLRASKNITTAISRLQDMFIEKINGTSEHNIKD
jgi:hypothetical protein